MRGADQATEFRDQRGRADRLLAARQDRVNVNGENVALLRALDRDRTVLRIEERKVQKR